MFTRQQIEDTVNWLDAEATDQAHMARDIIMELQNDLSTNCSENKRELMRLLNLGLDTTRYDDDMQSVNIPRWYWQYVQNLGANAQKAYDLLADEWDRYHRVGD